MYPRLTITQFLDNPMGKGSTAIPNRQLLKNDLDVRFNKLENIIHKVYKDGNDYYFHIIIPSESERNNTYDVVIQFYPGDENEFVYDNFLKRYYIRFFSNCPSFIYTFAQTFDQADFLIDLLKDKYEDKVLEDLPIVRNPAQIISYEKSIYFAAKYINETFRLKNKMYLNQISDNLDIVKFKKIIRHMTDIHNEIKKENVKISDKKKRLKKDEARTSTVRGKDRISGKPRVIGRSGTIRPSKKPIKPKAKITGRRRRAT